MSEKDAQKLKKGAVVGDFLVDPLPPIEFGRIRRRRPSRSSSRRSATPSASGSLKSSRTARGEIITGVVKRVEFGHIVVDLAAPRA